MLCPGSLNPSCFLCQYSSIALFPALFQHGSRHVFGKTFDLDNSIREACKNQGGIN